MAADIAIAVVGIFLLGAAAGVIIVVSAGIRREQGYFRAWQRYREERGLWGGPDAPEHFMPEIPPDRVTHGARALTRLFIRREPVARPQAVPTHDTWVSSRDTWT